MENKIKELIEKYKNYQILSDNHENQVNYGIFIDVLKKILDSEPSQLEEMKSEFHKQKKIVQSALEKSQEYFGIKL